MSACALFVFCVNVCSPVPVHRPSRHLRVMCEPILPQPAESPQLYNWLITWFPDWEGTVLTLKSSFQISWILLITVINLMLLWHDWNEMQLWTLTVSCVTCCIFCFMWSCRMAHGLTSHYWCVTALHAQSQLCFVSIQICVCVCVGGIVCLKMKMHSALCWRRGGWNVQSSQI